MSFWNKLTKLFKGQISFSFGRSFRINVHCCIQFCFCWIMLPFVLLFVTTMACSSFSQDSMMFIDRMLEQFSRTKRPKPSISKPKCPRELNASWLLRPPFTTTSGKNANEVGGINVPLRFWSGFEQVLRQTESRKQIKNQFQNTSTKQTPTSRPCPQ